MSEYERAFKNLMARIDRDGGHLQEKDASVAETLARGDRVVSELLSKVDHPLEAMREALEMMSSDDRITTIENLMKGFCLACGSEKLGVCYCTNDE